MLDPRRFVAPLVLLAILLGLPSPGAAVPSHLDLGFNAPSGYAVFQGWGSSLAVFNAAVDQPDGKHVLVGESGYDDLLVARYNADWSVDTSFGGGRGFALYDASPGNIQKGYAVALQADGMILAGGIRQDGVTSAVRPLVVRFTADGQLDSGFGGGDGVFVHEADYGDVRALVVQPDGKILVGMDRGASLWTFLVRLNADGSYDESFGGGDGLVSAAGSCFGLILQEDGKIVRAGSTYDGSLYRVSLRRFTRAGVDEGPFAGAFIGDVKAACALPGGGIAVAGEAFLGSRTDAFAVKYTAAGAVDTSFGVNGQVLWDGAQGRTENGRAIAPGPGGRIILAGYTYDNTDFDPMLLVLLADGSPDPDVGLGTGAVIVSGGTSDRAFAVIPEAGGTGIVLAGWTSGTAGADAALWRFSATGVPDDAFGGGDGVLTFDGSGSADDHGVQVAVAADGGIVVAGTSGHEGSTSNIVLLRYTAAGALDTSFGGGDGIFVYDGGGDDAAGGLIVLPGGGIVVSGSSDYDALVLKLTATGELDTSFSGDGIFTWDGGDTSDLATGVAAAPGGGLVVSGSTSSGGWDILVLKLTADGILDTSFSDDGVFTWGDGSKQDSMAVTVRSSDGEIFVAGGAGILSYRELLLLLKVTAAGAYGGSTARNLGDDFWPRSIALQPADGKVLVGGTLNGSSRSDVIVLRYTGDLDQDLPFGGVNSGVFAFAGNPTSEGYSVLPLDDGTILVTGQYTNALLMRLTADGALDSTFDGDGWTTLALKSRDTAAGVAVDASGRYVVAGTAGDGTGNPDMFTARFNASGLPVYGLTVGADGNGTGTVLSLPWIECGTDCSEDYPSGTQVTLTPQADPGSVFSVWAGDCTGPGPCTVDMTEARIVTATFLSQTQNTLTVSKSGTGAGLVTSDLGGIDCGSFCQADYLLGAEVTLTPDADLGSVFVSWSGCDAVEGTHCRVTLAGNRAVEAVFDVPSFTLTVNRSGSGTVNPSAGSLSWDGSTGTETYLWSTTLVTLTPEPAAGWVFSHWTGDCTGSGGCSVVMTDNRTVGVVFTVTTRRITVDTTGTGTVTPSTGALDWVGTTGTADYDYGTSVTLHAAPGEGYSFTGWTGDCTSAGTGDCDLAMTADHTVGAVFSVARHRLTVTLAGSGEVTADPGTLTFEGATGTADYDYGTPVTLHAAALPDYTFAGWSGSCSGTDDCLLSMTGDRSVGARFNRAPTLDPVADQVVAEGALLTFALVGADLDGDDLAYALIGGPAGAAVDPVTGAFSWTPWWDAAGEYPAVRVEVTDGAATAFREFQISVADTVNPARVNEHFPRIGADPDWLLTPLRSWSVDSTRKYVSKSSVNALARAKAIDATRPFTAGRITALMKISTPYAQYANAGLVFAWKSATAYRYVRLRAGSLLIGQVGKVGGTPPVTWSVKRPIALNKPYKVAVDIWPDGRVRVQVMSGTTRLPIYERKFPTAVAGRVGLLALKARSIVDDVLVQDESVLYKK